MPVTIGAHREHGFAEPIGLLSDCHRRIERFLNALQTVAEQARRAELTVAQREGLRAALQYFREAAPRHTADEEESLFPRLAAAENPEARTAAVRLAALEADHRRADLWHAEVDRLGSLWLEQGTLPESDADHLRVLLAGLSGLYRTHIATEDLEVFPVADRTLSREAKLAVGAEMAARRGVQFAAGAVTTDKASDTPPHPLR